MADFPDEELAGTRAAMAPTLAAVEAVLPWLTKQRAPRFAAALNQRWIVAMRELAAAWSQHQDDSSTLRQAVFRLYAIAIDSGDADCLTLGEALASAADHLDNGVYSPALRAALSATTECLDEPNGLEHEAFPLRARHFARRLQAAVEHPASDGRSAVIDGLFISELDERLALMREALQALPPDVGLIRHEARLIADAAATIELYGLMDLALRIAARLDAADDLETQEEYEAAAGALTQLAEVARQLTSR